MQEGALEGMGSGNYKTIYENKIQFTVEDRVAGALLRLLAFAEIRHRHRESDVGATKTRLQ